MSSPTSDNVPLTYNEKSRGGATGSQGPMSPAEGYGPKTDDPVSYQRYFSRIANPGPTYVTLCLICRRNLTDSCRGQRNVGFRHHGLPLVFLHGRHP
jgi:hypothetical protein